MEDDKEFFPSYRADSPSSRARSTSTPGSPTSSRAQPAAHDRGHADAQREGRCRRRGPGSTSRSNGSRTRDSSDDPLLSSWARVSSATASTLRTSTPSSATVTGRRGTRGPQPSPAQSGSRTVRQRTCVPHSRSKPMTLFVTKAAPAGDEHGLLIWGPAQAGVAAGRRGCRRRWGHPARSSRHARGDRRGVGQPGRGRCRDGLPQQPRGDPRGARERGSVVAGPRRGARRPAINPTNPFFTPLSTTKDT